MPLTALDATGDLIDGTTASTATWLAIHRFARGRPFAVEVAATTCTPVFRPTGCSSLLTTASDATAPQVGRPQTIDPPYGGVRTARYRTALHRL